MGYVGGALTPWFGNNSSVRAAHNMLRLGTTYAVGVAKEATPEDTGHLVRGWEVDPHVGRTMTFIGSGWEQRWQNEVDYAVYVNYGTGLYGPEHRKYLILPKRPGGVLHWVDRLTGEDMFARAVMHPGQPGKHMLEISAQSLEAAMENVVRPALRNWVRETERQNPTAVITWTRPGYDVIRSLTRYMALALPDDWEVREAAEEGVVQRPFAQVKETTAQHST